MYSPPTGSLERSWAPFPEHRTYAQAVKYGFNPSTFQIRRIPTPDWASTLQTWGTDLPDAMKVTVTEQQAELVQTTEQVLQWAMTDPAATARFQSMHPYAQGVTGDYFIGRQHIDLKPDQPNRLIVETECCLTSLDFQGLPAVYERFIVTLDWNLPKSTGQMLLAHDTERESQLAVLPLRLIRTFALSEIPDLDHLDAGGHALLGDRWDEALACIQQAAREIMEDFSSSGELDQQFFPCRVKMTGDYSIGMASTLDGPAVLILLCFTELQTMTSRGEDDYLGYELTLSVGEDGRLTYELWGSQAL